ncbi:MAG: MFS transporter [Chloroflexi bacterium]|nr:MFS transporter [Chloroflexota bacterium]
MRWGPPGSVALPSYRWVIAAVFWSTESATFIVSMTLGIMLPRITQDLSLTPLQGGSLASVQQLATVLLALASATWIPRYNPRLVGTVAVSAAAAMLFGEGWAPTYVVFLVVCFLYAVAVVISRTVSDLLRLQWFTTGEMALIYGMGSALRTVAQGVGMASVSFLMVALGGWRNTFHLYGLLFVAMAVPWVALARERKTEEYQARMAAQEVAPIRVAMGYREIWLLGGGIAALSLAFNAFYTFWPTFLVNRYQFPLATAGLIMALHPFGSVAASFGGGILSDRLGLRRPFLLVSALGCPVTYLAMIITPSVPLLAFFAFISGFLLYVSNPASHAIPFELPRIKPKEVVMANALLMTVLQTGSVVGPFLTGFIYQTSGSLFGALAVVSLFPFLLALVTRFLPETGWRARRGETA